MNIIERVGKNFIKLSVGSVFCFSGIGPKMKMENMRKVFYKMFNVSWTFLTSSKGLLKLFECTCLFHSLVRICFYLEKGSHYSNS